MLEVVTQARRIAAAMRALQRRLAGLPVPDVAISWQGGGRIRGDIVWLRDERLWWRYDAARVAGRHSLMFGHAPAAPTHSESATCEINLPVAGAQRRLAGAVVRASTGALYLAHSGKIGGSRPGRRQPQFRAFLAGGNWQPVRWPDGRHSELLLIAPLEGPRLPRQIARFVQAVHRYKRQDIAGPSPVPAALMTEAGKAGAAPGGSPAHDAADDPASLAALCDRPLVLEALAEALAGRGVIGSAGAQQTLFAVQGRTACMIEVETRTANPALAQAIGRLLLRSGAAEEAARAILIVPETAATSMLAGLGRHGVTVVRYRWQGARPVFSGLDSALG